MGFFKSNDADAYTGEDKIDTNNPVMFAEAGTFEQLPTGTEFQSFDPQHPTTAFKDFTKALKIIPLNIISNTNIAPKGNKKVGFISIFNLQMNQLNCNHLTLDHLYL